MLELQQKEIDVLRSELRRRRGGDDEEEEGGGGGGSGRDGGGGEGGDSSGEGAAAKPPSTEGWRDGASAAFSAASTGSLNTLFGGVGDAENTSWRNKVK